MDDYTAYSTTGEKKQPLLTVPSFGVTPKPYAGQGVPAAPVAAIPPVSSTPDFGREGRSVPEPIKATPQYSPEERQSVLDEVYGKSQPAQAITSAAPSTPYDPVAQLARLREIDPEKYGAAPNTGYFNNPAMNAGSMPKLDTGSTMENYLNSIIAVGQANKARTAATAQQGQQALEGMRERGLTNRASALLESQRALAGEERAFKSPEQAAAIRAHDAQARLAEAHAEASRLGTLDSAKLDKLQRALELADKKDVPAIQAKIAEIHGRATAQKIAIARATAFAQQGLDEHGQPMIQAHANGGEVRGYADGGGVSGSGAIGHSQTGQLHPLVSQYGQYLTAAAQTGVAPVPFNQYINLLGSTRNAMQQTPAQFADGGDVSALNRPLEGPGTGRSDSIPAVIDGKEPAALSKGEFVMDEVTTKYYGTKFLKGLQQKAKEAMAEGQDHPTSKSGFADGGAVAAGATDAPENQQRDAQGYSMSTFNAKTGGYDAVLKPSTSATPVASASTAPVQTFSTSADSALPTRTPSQSSGIGHNPAQAAGSGPQYANPPTASGASMDDQRANFLSGIRDSGVTPGLGNRAWFADGSVKPRIV